MGKKRKRPQPKKNKGGKASSSGREPRKNWWETLVRVKNEQSEDNLSIVSAGVSFYAFFAVFPAIAAAVSVYGVVADPQQLKQQLDAMSRIMPQQAYAILQDQLSGLVNQPGGALSLGIVFGILLTIWSANKGMKALMTALNIVYNEEETRGFVKQNLISLLLTFCAILLGVTAIGLIVAVPALIDKLNLPQTIQMLFTYLRWPLMALFVVFALAVAYRFCPDRKHPEWQWISWGSVSATVLWLAVSILFSVYVANFGNYSKIYGSMGAVIILLMWFFLTFYAVLLGGELNVQIENRTGGESHQGN
ncbi:MAG: YihY/virulence factor BrkB family protein [Desulfobacterales bacterium]